MNRAEKRRQKKLAKKTARAAKTAHAPPSPTSQPSPTTQQELDLAIQHHSSGRLAEAEGIYRHILKSEPDQPVAMHYLGVAAHQTGKNEEAIELILRALSVKPDYPEAHNNLGNIYKETDRFAEARSCFKKALALDSKYAEAHFNLGGVLNSLGDANGAITQYQKAIAITPNYVEAFNNLGNILLNQGRLDDAITNFKKAISINPAYFEGHNNVGNALHDLGNLDEAIASFNNAISIKPDYAIAYTNLGNTLKDQGKLEEAASNYRQTIALNPHYYKAYNNLGSILQDQGKLNEAMDSYLKALEIKPDFDEAHSNVWLVMRPMCRELFSRSEGRSSLVKIIDQLPNPPEPEIIRLQFNSLMGEDVQAAWKNVQCNLPHTRNGPTTEPPSNNNVTALLHYGRSGSGYLHSLLDNHPQISTLPGVYMSGFFGRGVWERLNLSGSQDIPEQFSLLYKVLFDARIPDTIPPAFVGDTFANSSVGKAEGFVNMGDNHDTPLTLDRNLFLENLGKITADRENLNHGQLFEAIHRAYEKTLGNNVSEKDAIFYHLHKNDPYSMANFLSHFPKAKILMIIRSPLQSCESWVRKFVGNEKDNAYKNYGNIVNRISSMLTDLNSPWFPSQNATAICLEDIKREPKETMRRLCLYLEIEDNPSLYESTMQGLKWWGDPSSSVYGRTHDTENWEDDPIRVKPGKFFSAADQFILETLFYPLSARFGYVEADEAQFKKDHAKIRPLLDEPMEFEKKLGDTFSLEYPELEKTDVHMSLHATLTSMWNILDKHGTYPNLMKPLPTE